MPFCKYCGGEVSHNARYCQHCSRQLVSNTIEPIPDPWPDVDPQPSWTPQRIRAFSIAGMVCGIAGVALSFLGPLSMIGFLSGIAGIVLSALCIKNNPGRKNGFAITGLVCGIVAAAIGLPMFLCIAGACTAPAGCASSLYGLRY